MLAMLTTLARGTYLLIIAVLVAVWVLTPGKEVKSQPVPDPAPTWRMYC
ncbi:MAG TPA: hypothetical protein VMM15_25025 [Bradyrhizobium sp.]|nr:hypothetical protein [Bradyrhizobium sp.]